ncbi:MAG: phosphatidylserine decarboxylase family protein [Calditrichaceae bacterium]|nr:phosphatidylserine decarboxylase family protein [Calditrichaceae bacterium]
MIAKDGYKFIIYTGLVFTVLLILAFRFDFILFTILAYCSGFLFVYNFFFLRDPERQTPKGDSFIISPADGTVIKIAEVDEPVYFKGKAQLISVFMSVFNVHVNRIPISGEIEYLDYKKGQYLAAFDDKATDMNEQSMIGIKGVKGRVYFKQVAGILARRIVYHLKIGDIVQAGERFGLIRYGSRLDVFVPIDAKINVQLKQKVRSGITILAEFNS